MPRGDGRRERAGRVGLDPGRGLLTASQPGLCGLHDLEGDRVARIGQAGYTIPLKIVRNHGVSFVETVFYMGIGAAVTGLFIFAACDGQFGVWWRQRPRDHAWAGVSGMLWSFAVLTMTEAIEVVGLAVTWPIANLNTVFAVALGVWVFHEVDLRRHGRLLSLGVAMAVVGTALLGVSRALR
ncbi:MAG TPA: GRP family sugar transporter [Armatimonadota bacterium]|nr:GRP family sugar transporter [Armatimonadota bacterium]